MRLFAGKGAVVAAIALGVFTSYIAWNYVNQARPSQSGVDTVPVVIAAVPIHTRMIITPDLLKVQQVPTDIAHPQAMHSPDQVIGKVARMEMTADEAVLSSKLYLQKGDSGLAFMVPDGMRAISVAFSEVMGSGGMVTPGDHVDVLGVFEATQAQLQASQGNTSKPAQTRPQSPLPADVQSGQTEDRIPVATLVLQDVEVLAVAQLLEGEAPPDKGGPSIPMVSKDPSTSSPAAMQAVRSEPTPMPAAKSATLAVTPDDALKLVLAEDKGKIRLALRRAKDTNRPEVAQVPMTAVLASAH